MIRRIGLCPEITSRISEERRRQFVREGYASDAHQLGRYAVHRPRAILVVTVIDLEMRLTDAVLDMADMADVLGHMRGLGRPVPNELLAHTSPLMWEHIGLSGDFLWDRAAATAGHHRPFNLGRERIAA